MQLRVCADPQEVAMVAADCIAKRVATNPETVLGLPTGRTVLPLYAELAHRNSQGRINFSNTRGFNLDELRIPSQHPESFLSYMQTHAWEAIGMNRQLCDIPSGEAEPTAECLRYDAALEQVGGFDLAILGVGEDGHVAYNLPGVPHDRTHVVSLPDRVAELLGIAASQRPLEAITVGMGALTAARQLIVLACGDTKQRAVGALLSGDEQNAWPCSLLASHPNLSIVVDRLALRAPSEHGEDLS